MSPQAGWAGAWQEDHPGYVGLGAVLVSGSLLGGGLCPPTGDSLTELPSKGGKPPSLGVSASAPLLRPALELPVGVEGDWVSRVLRAQREGLVPPGQVRNRDWKVQGTGTVWETCGLDVRPPGQGFMVAGAVRAHSHPEPPSLSPCDTVARMRRRRGPLAAPDLELHWLQAEGWA